MDLSNTIILSVIEGFTEFLPVSSTGHLILASTFLKIQQTNFIKDFEIIIQLGAILAVVFLYWKTLIRNKEVWKKILIAFLPTGLIGFLLFKFIKSFLLGNPYITVAALLIGGLILIFLEIIYKEKNEQVESVEKITYKNAFLIGIFQSLAVIPGVSRSASTIAPALFLGTKRKTAAEFSFLLAIPTMLAATGLDLIKSNFVYTQAEYMILFIGFVGSFITAAVAVKWFIGYVQNNTFIPFGVYRIILAIFFWFFILK